MSQAKKVFTRMCLNNWGGIDHKVLEFHEYVNLFSGKSGSGKSTVMDAIQVILYGSFSPSFLNKAADDAKNRRSVLSYLRGEQKDGSANRKDCDFCSVIALEMEIICDCKSGVTGAGRKPNQGNHYPELNEGFHAYKVASHRHTPEIEQTLSKLSGEKVIITFVPHLLPVNRGILATVYADIKDGVTFEQIRKAYEDFYKDEFFVRLLDDGKCADIHNIKYSNFCDVSIHHDKRANKLVACAAIDNMVKGAAGQAIQNMNIIFGLDEKTGLVIVPPAF